MTSQMDTVLKSSMGTYFQSFFSALENGSHSINSFLTTLASINNTIQTHRTTLQKETLLAVHDFSSVIHLVSSDFVDLEKSVDIVGHKVSSDVSNILNEKMANLTICEMSESSISSVPTSLPAYIKPSYDWLLHNLHNPYPSKDMKQSISRETMCSVKDIDAWFIDTRKRIGWNKLRKTKFSNKQEKIIAAATHVFKCKPSSFADDLNRSLISEMNSNDDYRSEFLTIQRHAKSLYANKFPELIASLDHSLQYIAPIQSVKYPYPRKEEASQHETLQQSSFSIAALDYPTPRPSPPTIVTDESPSPTPPALSNSISRKRRQSSEPCDSSEENSYSRPSKRHRSESTTPISSPLSKSNEMSYIPSETLPESLNAEASFAGVPVLKRKRRLSDGQGQGPPKRPHNALCLPRLQAVSDPMPLAKRRTISAFTSSEDTPVVEQDLSDIIPLPANVEDPVSGFTALDVDFYQYDCSPSNSEIYLPDAFPHDLAKGTPQRHTSNADPFDPLSFIDVLRDPGLHFLDDSNLSFDIVDPLHHLDAPCNKSNVVDEFPIFANPELLSLAPGYIPDYSPLIDHPYHGLDNADSITSTTQNKTSVLGGFNVLRDIPCLEEHEAKRARVRALREELALYEAEGL